MRSYAALAALCFGMAACSIAGDGSFEVTFIWADGEPAPSTAWIHARVEQRDDGPTRAGRSLGAATPVAFAVGASLELPSVPDGAHRVVVIEVRQSADPTSQVLYYGFSEEFSTKAGEKKTISVLLRLVPVPGGGASGSSISTVTVTTNGGIGIVPGPAVKLRLVTDTGVSARISNRVNFSSEATKVVDLGALAPATGAPTGAKAYDIDWDLDYGLPAHCVASNACERVVSVRFADAQGYESPTLTAQVRIDTKAPATLASGSKVLPAQASADAVVVVTLTATEILRGGPTLLVDGVGGSFALSAATPADQPSTTYLYEATAPAGEAWTEGSHALTATLVDLAGNTATAAVVGTLVVDRTAPVISGVNVTTPTIAGYANLADRGAGRAITIDFTVSETPATGYPQVRLGTHDATCAAGAAPRTYSCTCTLAASDTDGDALLDVLVADVAGNLGEHRGPEHVIFDFTPPAVAAASVTYAAGATNPLGTVTVARGDTLVTISISATEALGTATPALTVGSIVFTVASRSTSGVIFRGTPGAVPDGAYEATLAWSDLAGNATVGLALGTPIQVKTSAPGLVVDQTRVTFLRSPWGNGAIEDLESSTAGDCVTPTPPDRACIPAGPVFALAPPEPLSPTRSLDAAAFTLAGGGSPTAVRLWADAGRKSLMGMMRPNADGTWPRQRLASVDTVTAYATAVDAAGNESGTFALQNVDWVATPLSAGRANPHEVAAAPMVSPLPDLDPALATSPASTDAADGVRALVQAEPAWRQPPAPGSTPPSFSSVGAAFDRVRGRMVVFGGSVQVGPSSETNNVVWEWDGARWYGPFSSATQPEPVYGAPGLVYDGARGIVVYFVTLATTWEWDGVVWRGPFTSTNPPPATGVTSPVYDSDLERVVVFGIAATGATGQAWLWDGSSWTGPLGSGAQPAPTSAGAVVYDPVRGFVVLVDTAMAVWHWNGSTWAGPFAPTTLPTSTGPIVYDSVNEVAVMFVGLIEQPWAWNGSAWTPGPTTGAPSRMYFAAVFDDLRGRSAVFGGILGKSWIPDLYEWDGAAWSRWSMGTWPTARVNHAMAYDSFRGRVVLTGGRPALDVAAAIYDDLYEWDGQKWILNTPATRPTGRQSHAMAYDSVNHVTVLFGGRILGGAASDETWLWDGTSWGAGAILPATRPTARSGHAMAYDAYNSRTVLFGGGDDQTWLWNGATQTWTGPLTPTTRPPVLTGHAMAYDANRRVVVLAGGGDDAVWEWNGATLAWAGPLRPTTRPSSRNYATLAYDSDRRRVVLTGGIATSSVDYLDDSWEWDGAKWYGPFRPASRPSARERHAVAYDSTRHELALFGGRYGQTGNDELWERDSSPTRSPALQLTASWADTGISPDRVRGVRVRALCGGASGSGVAGATLTGWNVGSTGNVEGWAQLGTTPQGTAAATWADLIDWSAPTAVEARHYLLTRDHTARVRCLPTGTSGTAANGAQVAVDYAEVRVRYTAP